MNFTVNAKAIKTRELIEAQTNMEALVDIMARFVVDDSGAPIPQEQARELILDTDVEELIQAQEDFLAAFNLRRKTGRHS